MISRWFEIGAALFGGVLLATMVATNSYMAGFTTPLVASWTAHLIGAVCALALLVIGSYFGFSLKNKPYQTIPLWAYCGGIPGAMVVVLAAVTVNSRVGLSSSMALMLVGQLLFGLVCDLRGWLGMEKRMLGLKDICALTSIVMGSCLLIFG